MPFNRAAMLVILLCATGARAGEAPRRPADMVDPATDDHRIRLAYFVPRDRKPTANYEKKIRVVMSIVAEVYRDDLRSKKHDTPGLRFETDAKTDAPTIHLIRGDRDASHYNNAPAYDADEQWKRLLPEIRAKIGDPRKEVIVVFAETFDDGPAPHLWPGVIARGAYNTADGGLAVFSAHLLQDQFCALTVEAQKKLFYDETPVRGRKAFGQRMNSPRGTFAEDGIGAVAHELGHALGLPHDRRDDVHDIMGNGFRNLRWNFPLQGKPQLDRRVRFSDENARLLMSSRYLNPALKRTDTQPPQILSPKLQKQPGAWTLTLKASDNTTLRSLVVIDRTAGSVIAGRALTGTTQDIRERLTPIDPKSPDLKVQIILTDDGGHQTRLTLDSSN